MKRGKTKTVGGPPAPAIGGMSDRATAISGTKLLRSDAKQTRKLRKSVIEETYGHVPIR